MLVFLGLLLTIFFGLLITFIFFGKIHPLERLGLSYVLGLGLLTYLMFLSSLVGLRFTLNNGLALLLLAVVLLYLKTKNRLKEYPLELRKMFVHLNFSLIEKTIIFAVLGIFIYIFVSSIYWPVADWDAMALYDFRAKVFVDTGSMNEGINRGYFFGYPLLTSLANTWVYLLGGENPKFFYSIFAVSLVLMFYGVLRRIISRKTALLSVLLLITAPSIFEHSMVVYTNLPYTVYLAMGTIYLYLWLKKKETNCLFLSALLVGLSTWTRSTEPFWLTGLLFVLIYSILKKKIFWILLYGLVFFSIQQPWKIYESTMIGQSYSTVGQIGASFSTAFAGFELARVLQVLSFLYQSVILSWQPLLLVFLVILLIQVKNFFKQSNSLFLGMILINFLLLLAGTYIFSFNYSVWERIPGSAERMSMFFLPLFLFYIFTSSFVVGCFGKGRKK